MTDSTAPAAPPAAPDAAASAPAKRPVIKWDVVVSIVLIVLGIPLMLAIGLFSLMLPMASDPCGSGIDCNDTQFMIGWLIAMGAPVVFIASAAVAIVVMLRRRVSFWIPLVGAVVTLLVWLGGVLLVVAAVPGATL